MLGVLDIFAANVKIDKAPPMDLPKFSRHPQGLILNDGDPAVIECTVIGKYTKLYAIKHCIVTLHLSETRHIILYCCVVCPSVH